MLNTFKNMTQKTALWGCLTVGLVFSVTINVFAKGSDCKCEIPGSPCRIVFENCESCTCSGENSFGFKCGITYLECS